MDVISLSSREDDPMEVDTERQPGDGMDNVIVLSDDDDDDRHMIGNEAVERHSDFDNGLSHDSGELNRETGDSSYAGNLAIKERMEDTPRSDPNMLYTPLQRWEYENNLPVDGVEDTEAWAREVGLADARIDHSLPGKRQKKVGPQEPPKYINSDPLTFEELNLVHIATSSDAKESENIEKDKEADPKGKGKKKMDD